MNALSLAHTIKTCGCGQSFTRSQWLALLFVGPMRDDGVYYELRNCPCTSTIAVEQSGLIHVGSVIRYHQRINGSLTFVGEVRAIKSGNNGTYYEVTTEAGKPHTVVARWSRIEVLA